MVMTDHIYFVKETKTCSYVLVVHTPRLCSEPGFKSRRDTVEDSQIRCREVVDTLPQGTMALPTTDHPLKMPLRKPILPAPKAATKGSDKDLPGAEKKEKIFNDLLLRAYEALMEAKTNKDSVHVGDDDSGVVIELLDEATGDMEVESDRLVDALRAAGYDVRAEVITIKPEETAKTTDGKENKKANGRRRPPRDFNRDEL